MQVYLFRSEKDPDVRAFTADETGGSLPARFAPWAIANGGRSIYLGSASDPIAIDIKADGYHIVIA
jgi:hypothetical protein